MSTIIYDHTVKKFGKEFLRPSYDETWKIVTYPGIKPEYYEISTYGRVRNVLGNIMVTYLDKDNHEKITLRRNNSWKDSSTSNYAHVFIHRLMTWEFIGPPKDEDHNIVNHKSAIPYENFIHNLEWTSVLENTNHAKRMGVMNNSGVNAKICKYDESLIREIASEFEKGLRRPEVFGIIKDRHPELLDNAPTALYNLVGRIARKTSYREILKEYSYQPTDSVIRCTADREKIRELIRDNKTNMEILKSFGVDSISKNKILYNRIIEERAKCDVLFND